MATTKQTTKKQLDLKVFDYDVSDALLAQALYVYQENTHRGMSKTITRGDMDRTTKKVYKQKGTGNARHGARSAPIFVGGGVTFGPVGHKSVVKSLTKKVKTRALAGMLSQYRKEDKLVAFDASEIKSVSTQKAHKIFGDDKAVLVHHKETKALLKSTENLKSLTLRSAARLNAYHLSLSPKVYLTESAYDLLVRKLTPVMTIKTNKTK